MSRARSTCLILFSVLILGLTACSFGADDSETAADDGPRIIQPGAPGEPNRELTPEEAAAYTPPEATSADVAFMQGMIPHHAQALEMTALVPDRAASSDLALFAERMEVSQDGEIAQIQSWLDAQDEAVRGGDHGGHDGGEMTMAGMASKTQMAALADAEGEAFDRRFLELMQRHHEGALEMVADLYESGGGQEIEVASIANHIDSDQRIELARIATMLAELDTSR